MSNYIPSVGAQKKRRILAKRERELIHHLKCGSPLGVVDVYAEHVRAAQLALIKALLSEKEPRSAESQTIMAAERANLLAMQASWRVLSLSEIATRYHNHS